MSSVLASLRQPLTRSFVVTQDAGNWVGSYFYSESDFTTWLAANGIKIKTLGSLYIIPGTASGSTFVDVLTGSNGATELEHTNPDLNERKTLRDLGEQIIIGNGIDSRLLVFRRVAQYFDSTQGQDSVVGYVVVENNADDLQGNTGRFTVRVARI